MSKSNHFPDARDGPSMTVKQSTGAGVHDGASHGITGNTEQGDGYHKKRTTG